MVDFDLVGTTQQFYRTVLFIATERSWVDYHTIILVTNKSRAIRGQRSWLGVSVNSNTDDFKIEKMWNVKEVANVIECKRYWVPLELGDDSTTIIDNKTTMLGAH